MGSTHPYDCVLRHPYVFPGNLDDALPIAEYHSRFLSLAEEKAALVEETQALIGRYAGARAARIPVVLTEYGQTVDSNPQEFELYHLTLDQGLYLAEILRYWIQLGIPLAETRTSSTTSRSRHRRASSRTGTTASSRPRASCRKPRLTCSPFTPR
jgi:hypothetical protein